MMKTMCLSLVNYSELEKRRIHNYKQKQRANFSAKIESYEDLEAQMEHIESLVRGHFDEDPDRAMTRAEWEAIAVDSAKKAADARELLRLKKNEEDAIRARANAAQPPTPLKIMARTAPESPIGDVFGALANGDGDVEAPPDVPADVAKYHVYVRELLTIANETKILKSVTFTVEPNINAICQRMTNEVHKDALPGDSHVAAMESIKRVWPEGECHGHGHDPGLTESNVLSDGLSECTSTTAIAWAQHCPCTAEVEEATIPRTRQRPKAEYKMLQHALVI